MTVLAIVIEAVVLLLLAASLAVLSAADAAVSLLSRSRTRRLIEAERPGAEQADALTERPSRLAGATAVARLLAGVALAVLVADAVRASGGVVPLLVWIALTLLVALLGFALVETLPRAVAVHNPERVALACAPLAERLVAGLQPLARALSAGWLWLVGLVAEERVPDVWITADEYRLKGETEDDEVAREEAEEAFIDAVADFSSKIVREVMVPRTDMECLEDTVTAAEAIEAIERSGYSRLPVYHESVDDVLGILYAKDLLVAIGRGQRGPHVASLVREAYFVPETKPVEELLAEMRSRTHIAIVADEYGGTAGLVTIEDLLEEIVGEIFDEYDVEEPMVVALGDGRYRVDGRMPVDDLNELFGTEIDIEADSVGGLFVELAGRIPEVGETATVEGLLLTVEAVENNRVLRMTVESTGPRGAEDEEEDDA